MSELVWRRAPDRVLRRYSVEIWEATLENRVVGITYSFPEGWGGPPDTGWEAPGIVPPDGLWPDGWDINDWYGYLPTLGEAKAAVEATLRKHKVIP